MYLENEFQCKEIKTLQLLQNMSKKITIDVS